MFFKKYLEDRSVTTQVGIKEFAFSEETFPDYCSYRISIVHSLYTLLAS